LRAHPGEEIRRKYPSERKREEEHLKIMNMKDIFEKF
jgi:hypothetical protein